MRFNNLDLTEKQDSFKFITSHTISRTHFMLKDILKLLNKTYVFLIWIFQRNPSLSEMDGSWILTNWSTPRTRPLNASQFFVFPDFYELSKVDHFKSTNICFTTMGGLKFEPGHINHTVFITTITYPIWATTQSKCGECCTDVSNKASTQRSGLTIPAIHWLAMSIRVRVAGINKKI